MNYVEWSGGESNPRPLHCEGRNRLDFPCFPCVFWNTNRAKSCKTCQLRRVWKTFGIQRNSVWIKIVPQLAPPLTPTVDAEPCNQPTYPVCTNANCQPMKRVADANVASSPPLGNQTCPARPINGRQPMTTGTLDRPLCQVVRDRLGNLQATVTTVQLLNSCQTGSRAAQRRSLRGWSLSRLHR